jgi:superfamily I DNA/RNA helicase
MEHVSAHAAGERASLFAGLATVAECEAIRPAPREALAALHATISHACALQDSRRPSKVAAWLWEQIDYALELESMCKTREDVDARMANVQALIEGIAWFEQQNPRATLGDYLRDVALGSDEDDEELNGGKLPVMTIHASKGLEFPCVYVVGVEQGIIPHFKSVATEEGQAEERRLFYVAITRAREELTLTYARARTKYGQTETRAPSEFMDDIPEQVLDWQLDAYNQVAGEDEAADYLAQMRAAFGSEG